MYESFYGLKEKPFSLLPDPAFLYLSKQHEMAITLLEYSLENQAGFCVITGKAGTGKTTLVRRLLNQIGDDISIGLISNTHHSFGELLRWILHSYSLDDSSNSRARQHQIFVDYLIGQYAKNRRTMLIIDEAQSMSSEALEELRMLSNINSEKDLLLQVILVGQPPLRDVLRRPELEQFAQRVTVDFHLDSLGGEETRRYIKHRLRAAGGKDELFTDEASKAVYIHTGGVPRLINLLCDTALVYGYAGQTPAVTGAIIEQVVREREVHGALPVFNAAPESRTMPSMSMKDAPPAMASTPPETTATRFVRQGSAWRLAGEAGQASAAEENIAMSTARQDVSAMGRVHAVRNAAAGETQLSQMTSQSAAMFPNAKMKPVPEVPSSGRAVDQPAMRTPVTSVQAEKNVTPAGALMSAKNDAPDTAPPKTDNPVIAAVTEQKLPDKPDDPKPADSPSVKPGRKLSWKMPRFNISMHAARIRRFVPALIAIFLVTGVSVAWFALDREGLMAPISNYLSQAREAVMTRFFVTQPVDVPPARKTFSAMQPAPDESATPQAIGATSVSATNAAAETEMLKQVEKERDAILAIAEAARNEREALRKAALARERAIAAEHAAALERERALAKQHEMALLRERVRANQQEQAAELARQEARAAEIAAEARIKAKPFAPAITTPTVKLDSAPAKTAKVEAVPSRNPATESDAASTVNEESKFTANPCKGPSARFLSTCE